MTGLLVNLRHKFIKYIRAYGANVSTCEKTLSFSLFLSLVK